ncbi:MAG: phage tail sheath subtilisin-like domain-containing protein [Pseudobdellovibrionaceae bacterium]|nr:phage tail sheath subtilisin-like domain-containing protein [Pseudobdellovibrionaceae bacterium]
MADPAATPANAIVTKLKTISNRLGAIVVVDTPEDNSEGRTELKKFRDANGAANVYMVSPKAKVAGEKNAVDAPASAHVAGVFARINFWESPSNQEINGILGTSSAVSFALNDPQSTGQVLNRMQIATIVRQDGLRLWGARGTGDPTDLKTNQIQKVRIRDAIREAIQASHRWAVAKGITRNYFDAVANNVNAYLDELKRLGAIAGGKCYPDPDANTPTALNDGKVYWIYEFTPTPVSETLTFTEEITDKYLEPIGA